MCISIITFFVVAVALGVLVNLLLPMLWHQVRLRRRDQWAAESGFQRCEPSETVRLENVMLPLFRRRSGRVLSCLSRGPLTLIDYAFTQSVGGGPPSESVDVRRATTVVLVTLGRDAPLVTVRPRVERVPRFLLKQFVRLGGSYRSIIDAVFASIETGDYTFDSAFQVLGDDESRVRAVLRPGVRLLMLANRRFFYEIGGRHFVVYASGLVFDEELERMIMSADKLRTELP